MSASKKLLIIGTGDSIFLVNYVKALNKVGGYDVTVYSPHPYGGNYKDAPYKEVFYDNYMKTRWHKIPLVSYAILPFVQRLHFKRFIKNRNFDIIHIHRVIPAWTICPSVFRNHCDLFAVTFWGGEIDREVILFSRWLYLKQLKKLLYATDRVVNTINDEDYYLKFPFIKAKQFPGIFGSSIIDCIHDLHIDKGTAKEKMNIPRDKITVLLGYSGKEIHQHIGILNKIICNKLFQNYKNRIHFIAHMTRGASVNYTNSLESLLETTGCTYTMIKNCYQSDTDVALLRIATDVFFQLSTSDGFSASVRENLCSGTIMISGSWLPYQVLKDEGFVFEEADDVASGVSLFYNILGNFNYFQKRVLVNRSLCVNKYSWDACIEDFVSAYSVKQ